MQEAIRAAQSMATRLNHQQLDAEHVLAALLNRRVGSRDASLRRRGSPPTSIAASGARSWAGCQRLPAPAAGRPTKCMSPGG